MRGVFFDQRAAKVVRSPYRSDVALFVGFVDRRRAMHAGGAPGDHTLVQPIVPVAGAGGTPWLYRWLVTESWARGDQARDRASGIDELRDVPVPIDSFATFDRLFAWDARPCGDLQCDTYLGAAVRSFFAEGGRLCYVARVGEPWPVPLTPEEATAAVARRDERIAALIPVLPSPVERATWKGVWAVYGLPDVSFVALPDLPDVVRAPVPADRGLPVSPVAVGFVECSDAAPPDDDSQQIRNLAAPVADDAGFARWARAIADLTSEVARPRPAGDLRGVQVVAAIPRPADDRAAADLTAYLRGLPAGLDRGLDAGGLSSAFLQLAYPWLSTSGSQRMPEGIEPPDATLCGALAANALERGTYRSAGNRALVGVVGTRPALAARDLADPADLTTLGARAALLGATPDGFAVLSDVTTSRDPTYRLAHANRLMSALVRALRALGELHAFEASNAALWAALRARIRDLLHGFWRAGALHGTTEDDAFTVRCDRTTMSQDDLDAGRVIAEVDVSLTTSIQRISVVVTRSGSSATLERAA
jgi:hypothetical protein